MHYLNSVLNNKYFKGCFVVFLWLLFFFMGWLTQERFIAFCCTLFIIFIYISCYRLCALLGSTYFNKTVKMFIIKNENVFIQIHRILLLLNTLKNPILFLCVYLDKLLYIVFKALRSTIIKEPVYTFICFLIDLSLFGIIKICLGFFYKLLVSFKMLSFYDLLIKRMYGLIFSILIFTHILFCIKAVLIQHGFKGVFILYFSIVILYIILDFISIVFRYNKALIEKKTNIIIVFIASILDFIMRHSKAFLSSHNLKSLREIATILPLFINFLNLSLIVIREDSMEQYQI